MKRILSIAGVVLIVGLLLGGCGVPKNKVDEMVAAAKIEGYKKAEEDLGMTVSEAKNKILTSFEAGKAVGYKKAEEDLGMTIEEAKSRLTRIQHLRPPTYSEILAITNYHNARINQLGVGDYAFILYWEARSQGIKAYLTRVTLGDGRKWYFTSFDTVDKGRIHFVAYPAQEVKLEVGKKYKELNPQFYLIQGDDTILKIEFFE